MSVSRPQYRRLQARWGREHSMKHRIIPDIVHEQDIHALNENDTAFDAAKRMIELDVGAMVVNDAEGNLAGIVSERDIARRVVARSLDPKKTLLSEIMTRDPDTLNPRDTAIDALEIMRLRHHRHLPVVEGGRVVGMVSIRDLYEVMRMELENSIRETEAYVFGDRYGA
jgi:CBS domain-containing protein